MFACTHNLTVIFLSYDKMGKAKETNDHTFNIVNYKMYVSQFISAWNCNLYTIWLCSSFHSMSFQTYSMDCYFRQSWVDKRLSFPGPFPELALSIEMLRKIWKPDTYIYNGRRSYLHTITTPNKFVRLFPNGRVLYSQR